MAAEAETAPAEAGSAPAEAEVAPAEPESAPAEAAPAPLDVTASPPPAEATVEAEAAPAEAAPAEAAPAEAASAPAEAVAAPAEPESAPAEAAPAPARRARRVSIVTKTLDVSGVQEKEEEGTVVQIKGDQTQVELANGTKVWRCDDAIGDAEEVEEAEEAEAGEAADWVADMISPPARKGVQRKLQKAGVRGSRRMSFLRRSNEAVQMSDVEQAEYFLRQFAQHSDVGRKQVKGMLKDFVKYDKGKKGHLEEDEAMMMLESRGDPTSFVELRSKVRDIDLHKKRNLTFLEWCCAVFDKSWIELHQRSDLIITPEIVAEMEAMKREMEEASAQAEAAHEHSLRAKSMRFKTDANAMKVSVLLCTVTYHANRAHNLTRSPSHL